MLKLIVYGCLFGAAIGHSWGHLGVTDTPEVEAAKAKHLAAHAKARATLAQAHSARDRSSMNSAINHETPHHTSHYEEPYKKWTGPMAFSPGFDKYGAPLPVEDTHEVAAERARHFKLYSYGAYAGAHAVLKDHSTE